MFDKQRIIGIQLNMQRIRHTRVAVRWLYMCKLNWSMLDACIDTVRIVMAGQKQVGPVVQRKEGRFRCKCRCVWRPSQLYKICLHSSGSLSISACLALNCASNESCTFIYCIGILCSCFHLLNLRRLSNVAITWSSSFRTITALYTCIWEQSLYFLYRNGISTTHII